MLTLLLLFFPILDQHSAESAGRTDVEITDPKQPDADRVMTLVLMCRRLSAPVDFFKHSEVPPEGFEPSTSRLRADYSGQTEL